MCDALLYIKKKAKGIIQKDSACVCVNFNSKTTSLDAGLYVAALLVCHFQDVAKDGIDVGWLFIEANLLHLPVLLLLFLFLW